MKYQSLREALDDFPPFEWTDLNTTVVGDLTEWKKDYSELMQAIQDGTVKYDN